MLHLSSYIHIYIYFSSVCHKAKSRENIGEIAQLIYLKKNLMENLMFVRSFLFSILKILTYSSANSQTVAKIFMFSFH